MRLWQFDWNNSSVMVFITGAGALYPTVYDRQAWLKRTIYRTDLFSIRSVPNNRRTTIHIHLSVQSSDSSFCLLSKPLVLIWIMDNILGNIVVDLHHLGAGMFLIKLCSVTVIEQW